ncbi:unnamed protein product [Brassica rapa subsp. trilocularis]
MTSTEFSFSVSLGFPRRPPSLESPAVTAVNHCTESELSLLSLQFYINLCGVEPGGAASKRLKLWKRAQIWFLPLHDFARGR